MIKNIIITLILSLFIMSCGVLKSQEDETQKCPYLEGQSN